MRLHSRREFLETIGGLGVAVGSLSDTGLAASEWWSQFGATATNESAHPGTADLVQTPTVSWTYSFDSSITTQPIIGPEYIYIVTEDGRLRAVSHSGVKAWTAERDGTGATPAVIDGTIYTPQTAGSLVATSTNGGSQQWDVPTGGPVDAPVTVRDTQIYLTDVSGRVHAIDGDRQRKRWTSRVEEPIDAAPAVGPSGVYITDWGGKLHAFDTDGGSRWTYDSTAGEGMSPILTKSGICFTTSGTEVHFVDPTGEGQWDNTVQSEFSGPPAIAHDRVFASTIDGTVHSLAISNGQEHWSTSINNTIRTAPTIGGQTLYLGTEAGKLIALSTSDGTIRWTLSFESAVRTAPTVIPSGLLVGTDGDNIHKLTRPSTQTTSTESAGAPSVTTSESAGSTDQATSTLSGGVVAGSLAIGTILLGAGVWRYRKGEESEPSPGEMSTRQPKTENQDRTQSSRSTAAMDDEPGTTEGIAKLDPAADSPVPSWSGLETVTDTSRSGPIRQYAATLDGDLQLEILQLSGDLEETDSAAEAFLERARAWESISHNPHISSVYSVGGDSQPWVAFDPANCTLRTLSGPLTTETKLRLIEGIIDGLRTANLYNVSHGGLNPDTVVVATDEYTTALADWGLRQATERALGEVSMTPYTAPEQLRGETQATTDTYRVAAVAYWLLTGREPYFQRSLSEQTISEAKLRQPSQIADLPAAIDPIFEQAMKSDPAERDISLQELKRQFRDVLG